MDEKRRKRAVLVFYPMDQFLVEPPCSEAIRSTGWTPTTATLWMFIAVLSIAALFMLGTRGRAVIPTRTRSRWSSCSIPGSIYKMVEDCRRKGWPEVLPYTPSSPCSCSSSSPIFSRLIPASFSPTSQIAVTAFLALAVFLTVITVGLGEERSELSGAVLVTSAPLALRPVLCDHRR